MNSPLCINHMYPLNLICAQITCSALICQKCFPQHHSHFGHSLVLMLNNTSIGFFLDFSNYLVQIFERYLQMVKKDGFKKIFEIKNEDRRYVLSKQSEDQITHICINFVQNYRNLIHANQLFVLNNKHILNALHHPDFLKDFSTFLVQSWAKNGINLAERLSEQLIKAFPYRLSFKNIKFSFNNQILTQIELKRSTMVQSIKAQIFVSIDTIHNIQEINKSQLSNQARVQQEIRTIPNSLKFIESFEQILDGSYLSFDTDNNLKHILQESIETLSPNFLSMEEMEKQIQILLVKNQALKQQNYQLKFQNEQLRLQNAQLRKTRSN